MKKKSHHKKKSHSHKGKRQKKPINAIVLAKEEKFSYNKTLIVGHKLSDHIYIADLLHANGMRKAMPLQKEKVPPQEITTILSKSQTKKGKGLRQLEVSPVWDGLAMDLFMSNLGQKWWGWSDSKAVSLLEYWKNIDANMSFVLVYCSPQYFLKQFVVNAPKVNQKKLNKAIKKWLDYNRTLLDFYYQNTDRSLLINAEEAKRNKVKYLEQVQKQIGTSSSNANVVQPLDYTANTEENYFKADTDLLTYVLDDLVEAYPEMTVLYEEFEAVSNLPLLVKKEKKQTPLSALSDLLNQKKKHDKAIGVLKEKEKLLSTLNMEKSILEVEAKEIEKELEKLQKSLQEEKAKLSKNLENDLKEKQALQKEKEKLNTALENLKKKTEDTQKAKKEKDQESELLLSQLHSVQEELEKFYLENSKKETRVKELEKLQNSLQEEKAKLNRNLENDLKEKQALQQEKENLYVTLENLKKKTEDTQKAKKEKDQESELLLSQLHSVQEELEKYYLENQKLKEKAQEKRRYYGAAERVKSQLPYMLGLKIIEKNKSFIGTLTIPLALLSVKRKYKKQLKDEESAKLPPIESYADAYEAERARKHLSYALGEATIKTMKNPFGIFILPFALTSIRKNWKQNREL